MICVVFVFFFFFLFFVFFFFFFFFSSRRRHTRFDCDWSSRRVLFRSVGEHDVASGTRLAAEHVLFPIQGSRAPSVFAGGTDAIDSEPASAHNVAQRLESCERILRHRRSEERRVGKEGRARGGAEQKKR